MDQPDSIEPVCPGAHSSAIMPSGFNAALASVHGTNASQRQSDAMRLRASARCIVPPALATELGKLLPAQTDAMVMGKLGISWTTWMKIRTGRAIRLSTAHRMLDRVARDPNCGEALKVSSILLLPLS